MSGLVKHYQDTMKGIPQLTNNWGAMITLLDAVLVTGFNYVSVVGLTKANATAITATINLGSNHGFIDRQVVRIAGSTNGWNGDYKVLSSDSTSITVECTAEHPSTVLGTVTCFTAPLDFEIVHQTPTGSTEPKRAYRSTDPESLGLILLVHDFCVSGAAATGAKFAKVGIVDEMTSIDNITGNIMPYSEENPLKTFSWDGVTHGWAKWYYAIRQPGNDYTQHNDTATPDANSRSFTLVGDSKSFVFVVNHSLCPSIYGALQFFDEAYQGENMILLATGVDSASALPQNTNGYTGKSGGYGFVSAPGVYGNTPIVTYGDKGRMWFNSNGLRIDSLLARPIYTHMIKANDTTSNTHLQNGSPNPFIFIQNFISDSGNIYRGVLPFLRKCTCGSDSLHNTRNGKVRSVYYSGRGSINIALSLEER